MAFTPNLGPKARAGYVAFGLALAALGGYALAVQPVLPRWAALVGIIAGAVIALEGAAGF